MVKIPTVKKDEAGGQDSRARRPSIGRKAWQSYKTNQSAGSATGGPNWALVNQYLPLLKSIVGRMRIYFPEEIDIQDIYSLGIHGLINAVVRYDPTKTTSFGSYAALRIRGSIIDELRKMDWMPRAGRVKAKQIRKAAGEIEQAKGRPATDREIMDALKMPEADYLKISQQMQPLTFISLDSSIVRDSEHGASVHDSVGDLNEENARERCEKREVVDLIKQRIMDMPEAEKKVLAMYYFDEMRLAEIATVMKLTESRICQIHSQALTDLKQYIKRARNN